MPYQPILGTLGYMLSPDGKNVLLLRRDTRPNDFHAGKYNGLGGKLEADEDVATGMRREILEESGLIVTEMTLRGTVSWPGFGKDGQDWFGFIFLITAFEGQLISNSPEGSLHWIDRNIISELPMWEGDRYFLPLVFDNNPNLFHGIMPYSQGQPVRWSYTR